ncbi:tellurite resistance TerB C-terminal domain-containing protein [Vagococcus carniphilus]|uniref:tellurite resistance TerB C-terminal domain-containing protein n=1 Tax=Vagococcus carniphilus TaxID=218144 RepID=UPI00289273AC|nr:tellurite resistance TerB C-terminal domain-containing protein [Vagococcus carniphilus]MDT2849388.1 tellurite resistance TerB C-terminal domain-containing protein [Vagococcus carniphilus]
MKKILYIYKSDDFEKMNKKKWIAGLLAIFLGWIGYQKFYLKNNISGIIFISALLLIIFTQNLFVFLVYMLLLIYSFIYSFIEGCIYLVTAGKEYLVELKRNIYSESNKKSVSNRMNLKKKNSKKRTKTSTLNDKRKIKKQKTIHKSTTLEQDEKRIGENETSLLLAKPAKRVFQEGEKTLKVEELPSEKESVIDITDIEDQRIIAPASTAKQQSEIDWLSSLEIPYERVIMENKQIKNETLKLYATLCNFTDNELKKDKQTLLDVCDAWKQNNFYNNLLYTFYCIAEGHVTKAYSIKRFYDNTFSYSLLEDAIGKKMKDKIQLVGFQAQTVLKSRIKPDSQLEKDNNDLASSTQCWWDKDGELQKKYSFLSLDIYLLNNTYFRETRLWELSEVKLEIIKLYLNLWKIILAESEELDDWGKMSLLSIEKIKKEDRIFNERTNKFMSALMKISENEVRNSLPKTSHTLKLNVSESNHLVDLFVPNTVREKITQVLNSYEQNRTIKVKEMLLTDLYNSSAKNANVISDYILIHESDDFWCQLLIKEQEAKDYLKALKLLQKNTNNTDLKLVSCFEIARNEKMTMSLKKAIEEYIYPDNLILFEEQVKLKEPLSLERVSYLLKLKNPLRKKVNLDRNQIENSKKELTETINSLDRFLDESEDFSETVVTKELLQSNQIENKTEKNESDYSKQAIQLISQLIKNEKLSISDVDLLAKNNGVMLNMFLKEINQEFYEALGDQMILIEEDYVIIDSYYVEFAKEVIENEK